MRNRVANGASRHANAIRAMNFAPVILWENTMTIEITKQDLELILASIEMAIKYSPSSLQAASALMPLVEKLGQCKESVDVSSS